MVAGGSQLTMAYTTCNICAVFAPTPRNPAGSEVVWNIVSAVLLFALVLGVVVAVRFIVVTVNRQRSVRDEVMALRDRVEELERGRAEP